MDQQKLRFRLGLFVLVSAILLAGLVLMFGSSGGRIFTRQNEYTIPFKSAPGVSVGTPVRRSGVKIGAVTKVELNDETGQVLVTIAVERQYTVRSTDVAEINQDLLSRDTTIDLVTQDPPPQPLAPPRPAGPKNEVRPVSAIELPDNLLALGQPPQNQPVPPPMPAGGEPLPPGAIIPSRSPADARAALGQVSNILPTAEAALQAIRRLAERLDQTVPQIELAAREFADLGKSIRESIPEVRRTNDELQQAFRSFRGVGPELRKTNEELQVTLRNFGSVAERVDVFMAINQDKITRAVDQTTDLLQRLSNILNDENQKNFTATLRAIQMASVNFESISRNADATLKEAPEMIRNLNQTTKSLADRGERILRNVDTSVEQLNRVLNSVAEALAPLAGAGGAAGGGTLQKLFTDPSLYNNLNEAACIVAKVMPRLDRILRDVEVFADKIARHPETIGIGGAVRPSAGLKEGPSSNVPPQYRPYP
jgi:phospholipid/cholesterol/gamma-HCH transport system substrate-binding protein